MATCKWCNRDGFFLTLNDFGVCKFCSPIVVIEILQGQRIISDSISIIEGHGRIETKLERIKLLKEHANNLLKYEAKGIPLIYESPSVLLAKFANTHHEIIGEYLKTEIDATMSKVKIMPTIPRKLTALTSLFIKIDNIKISCKDSFDEKLMDDFDQFQTKISTTIQMIQLEDAIKTAEKFEFKKQNKKALEKYYDALYLLRHDNIDDTLQHQSLKTIEDSIIRLGGTLQ
jgi:hypothetical protein